MTTDTAPPPSPCIDIFVVSHTNVGKTSLVRTLVGQDVGEVEDAPLPRREAPRDGRDRAGHVVRVGGVAGRPVLGLERFAFEDLGGEFGDG